MDEPFVISESEDVVRSIRMPRSFVEGPLRAGAHYVMVQVSERQWELKEMPESVNGEAA